MKPRIFVSSTFYDLKYIREDLANFIRSHDFEPVLFEDGDIGYTPGSPLDDSCYKAMETADMALLIIGGSYGSAATGETPDDFGEFLSITRKEFQKAVDSGVPLFVFVDRNVYSEYGVYSLNSKDIETGKCNIKFRTTKNINVFRFIREIQSIQTLSITEFDKVAEIKEFLSKQWSDMFKSYLASIKERKEIERVQGSIDRMNILIEKMDKILDVVGKAVLKDSKVEYNQILEENERAKLKNVCLTLSEAVSIKYKEKDFNGRIMVVDAFLEALRQIYEEIENYIKEENIKINDFLEGDPRKLLDIPFRWFYGKGLSLYRMSVSIISDMSEVSPCLQDEKMREALKTVLCEDTYFNKMFSIEND